MGACAPCPNVESPMVHVRKPRPIWKSNYYNWYSEVNSQSVTWLRTESVQVSSRHGDAADVTPISDRRPTVDTPVTLDDQHSISSLTSLRHCSHGDGVTGNCRLANCDKTSRGRGRTLHAVVRTDLIASAKEVK